MLEIIGIAFLATSYVFFFIGILLGIIELILKIKNEYITDIVFFISAIMIFAVWSSGWYNMLESLGYSFVYTVLIAAFCFFTFIIIEELKSLNSKKRKILLIFIGSFLFVWFVLFLVYYIGGYYVC